MVRNTVFSEKTGLPPITDIIDSRRLALFGHVARLGSHVPANMALWLSVRVRSGNSPSPSWKRPRGRRRDSWLRPLPTLDVTLQQQWDAALKRGQVCRRDISRQTSDLDDDDDNG